jgi:hypothetical protein
MKKNIHLLHWYENHLLHEKNITSELLEASIVINFRAREMSQCALKLTQIPMLIKKKLIAFY